MTITVRSYTRRPPSKPDAYLRKHEELRTNVAIEQAVQEALAELAAFVTSELARAEERG